MSKKKSEHRYTSLRVKAVKMIIAASLFLIILGSSAGLLLHVYSSLCNYKSEADNLIDYMMSMEDMEYIDKLFAETRGIYNNLPAELRSFDIQLSDEYVAAYSDLIDDDYMAAKEVMTKCLEETSRQNLWLFFIEPDRDAFVYVLDADPTEYTYPPGFWLQGADAARINDICDSRWRLEIVQFDKNGFVAADYKRIYSPKGKVIGYVEMDLELTGFAKEINRFLLVLIPAIILLVILMAAISARALRKFIISHITELAEAANEYTKRDNSQINEETPSIFQPLELHTADEIEKLWLNMTNMEIDVKKSMLKLREMTAERERIGAELEIAKKIQMGMLPDRFPERDEFELYASMEPAKEVGGDIYDFFLIDDDHLALVVADVSGKGVSAALFMTVAKTLIKNQSEQGENDPAVIMNRVNEKLMEVNKARLFVTTWLGLVDLRSGETRYVDAGHEYPAIYKKGGHFEALQNEDLKGVPLAASKRWRYQSGSIVLNQGDTLFLYTDGVTEANNDKGEMMGRERLYAALNRDPDTDPMTLINNVRSAIDGYVKDAPQFDDLTMLCFRFRGRQ